MLLSASAKPLQHSLDHLAFCILVEKSKHAGWTLHFWMPHSIVSDPVFWPFKPCNGSNLGVSDAFLQAFPMWLAKLLLSNLSACKPVHIGVGNTIESPHGSVTMSLCWLQTLVRQWWGNCCPCFLARLEKHKKKAPNRKPWGYQWKTLHRLHVCTQLSWCGGSFLPSLLLPTTSGHLFSIPAKTVWVCANRKHVGPYQDSSRRAAAPRGMAKPSDRAPLFLAVLL